MGEIDNTSNSTHIIDGLDAQVDDLRTQLKAAEEVISAAVADLNEMYICWGLDINQYESSECEMCEHEQFCKVYYAYRS